MKQTNLGADRAGERSFTLIETLIAVFVMITMSLEMAGTIGSIVSNSSYTRQMTEAIWLARRVMTKVEYHWQTKDFKELEKEVTAGEFRDIEKSEYKYDLKIKEWKVPLFNLIGGGGGGEDGGEESSGEGDAIRDLISQQLGDDILKVAHVEVYWSAGARKESVTLTYLLTAQRTVNEKLIQLEPQYREMMKKVAIDLGMVKKSDSLEKQKKECALKAPAWIWDKARNKCLPK